MLVTAVSIDRKITYMIRHKEERVYFDLGQFPFKGRLLVCDMDGTLLNSSSKVSEGNRKALERFVEGGGMFTVATGRMEKSVVPYLDKLPVNVPAIVYNGAAIYDFKAGRILWRADLDTAVAGAVRDVMERFPGISVQVYHGGTTYFVTENEYSDAHRIRENFEPVRTGLDEVPVPWFKIILAWDPLKLKDVEEFLRGCEAGCKAGCEAGCKAQFRQVYSEPQFLELLNPAATKGSALKVLTDILEIDRSCVISMGDNLNDIELIKEAGTGIAVGNAHSALKAAAAMCCTDHDSDAVSEVICWLENGRFLL
jgi:hypothetical protein